MRERDSDGVYKCCASPDIVLIFRHLRYIIQAQSVMQEFCSVVEQKCGHIAFTFLLTLLPDHSVETADRVFFKTGHGAAPVQYEYEFRCIVFHSENLLSVMIGLYDTKKQKMSPARRHFLQKTCSRFCPKGFRAQKSFQIPNKGWSNEKRASLISKIL